MSNILNFKGHDMRHIVIDGEPWIVAADVCRILALDLSAGTYMHLVKLDADEKQRIIRPKPFDPKSDLGAIFRPMDRSMSLVSESGLYKITMRADAAIAKPFQDWVTREVLPTIRKTGGYLLNEDMRTTAAADSRTEFPVPTSFREALLMALDADERASNAERIAKELAAAREADKPKVAFHDQCALDTEQGLVNLREAAKVLGIGPIRFTSALRERGILYHDKWNNNRAKAEHITTGRFNQRIKYIPGGRQETHIMVTPAGMAWLHGQLSKATKRCPALLRAA